MASVAGRNTSVHLIAILKANGIDPDRKTSSGQTAFEVLERHIAGALEDIEGEDGPFETDHELNAPDSNDPRVCKCGNLDCPTTVEAQVGRIVKSFTAPQVVAEGAD